MNRGGQAITNENAKALSIPEHELLRPIASGSYGEVWLARNAVGTFRAVKIVRSARFERREDFDREFRGLQRFEPVSRTHEALINILQIGCQPDWFYYIMELADEVENPKVEIRDPKETQTPRTGKVAETIRASDSGVLSGYAPRTLRADLKKRGALPADEVMALGCRLASALKHLHSQNLVHRDVKPSNVLFVKGQPKLADAGLVTAVDDAKSMVGTLGYIPPEGPGTPQADIYSLGKVLYEASFGKDRQDFPQLPQDISSRPDHHRLLELNEVIVKASAPIRERYTTAKAMEAELNRLARGESIRRSRRLKTLGRLVLPGTALLALAATLFSIAVSNARHRRESIPQSEKRSEIDAANRTYDLGRFYFEKTTGEGFAKAATYFEQAIKLDPKFAEAYGSLALTYTWSVEGWNEEWKFLPKAKEAALRALALDESLPEAHAALGWHSAMLEWAWVRGESELRRAIQLARSRAIFHQFYGDLLRMMGRTNEALGELKIALRLEPRSMPINTRLADFLVAARQYEAAITQADQALAMEPNIPALREFRIRAWAALGNYAEVIKQVGIAPDGRPPASAYWETLLSATEQSKDSPYWRARALAQLGQREKAIESLQISVRDHDLWLTFYVKTDWTLDSLRADPRFVDILKTMHLQ
jgi:serine/threonine protein kinase